MKKLTILTIFLILPLALSACSGDLGTDFKGQAPNEQATPDAAVVEPEQDTSDDAAGSTERKPTAPSDTISQDKNEQVSLDKADQSKEEPSKPIERKIIRNASLQLESTSPDEVQQKITAIAESKKGFVVQSRKSAGGKRGRGGESISMTIRIPAASFNESLEEIRKTADRVVVESVTGRDVTEEFIDIEARLKAKKATEERFLEIMKQSKNVRDALNVQRELGNVRAEIERIEGRKRFLENQASLSTINISVSTPTAISGSSSGFFYELREAVSDGFDAALTFILVLIRVLIAIIPFLLLIVLPILLVLRYVWRNCKKRRLARKIAEEEIKEETIDE